MMERSEASPGQAERFPYQNEVTFECAIRNMKFWAPTLENEEAQRAWLEHLALPTEVSVPKIAFIPASIRRRTSAVAKMMLYSAFEATDEQERAEAPVVVATQGGESEVTIELLVQLAQQELLSPLKFSLSVHNAMAGLLSMATKNQSPSTTISAGNASFCCGLLESLMQLRAERHKKILFIGADEWLPNVLANEFIDAQYHYGLALLLEQVEDSPSLTVSYRPNGETRVASSSFPELPQPYAFVRWWYSELPTFELIAPHFNLTLNRSLPKR